MGSSTLKTVSVGVCSIFESLKQYQWANELHVFGKGTAEPVEGFLDMHEQIENANEGITALLNRLTPKTFNKEDPNASDELYEFLSNLSLAYAPPGTRRCATPILGYLVTASYDHTFWLWMLWVGSCIDHKDYTSAEQLLEVAREHTEFSAARAEHYRWLLAKALLVLYRDKGWDGCVDKADELITRVKDQFLERPEAQAFYKFWNDARKAYADERFFAPPGDDRDFDPPSEAEWLNEYDCYTTEWCVAADLLITGDWDGTRQQQRHRAIAEQNARPNGRPDEGNGDGDAGHSEEPGDQESEIRLHSVDGSRTT